MSDLRPAHNEFNGTVGGRLVQADTVGSPHAPQDPADPSGDGGDEEPKAARHQSVHNTANGHFAGDVVQAASIHFPDFAARSGDARSGAARPTATERPGPVAEERQETARESGIRRHLRILRRDRG
ncbi:hypothetical protein ACFC58_37095 [Kitasatospora purpeofusca]|uniref:hypothetical protein n=1 Tax=Kitasatospora purpeofusca TaxID=67352 RepID=UPI0035D67AE9